ncbi:hypothetical protein Tco_0438364 [Tanacetum coccineum]
MGLDVSYLEIRSNILTREPLPLVKVDFVVVFSKESHRNVSFVGATRSTATAFVTKTFDSKRRFNNNNNFNKASSSNYNSNNRGPDPKMKYANCNNIRYIVYRCFELVSYLAGFVKRNSNASTRPATSNNAYVGVHSNNNSTDNRISNSLVSLSNKLLARLISLFKDNGVSSTNSNMTDKCFKVIFLMDVSNSI